MLQNKSCFYDDCFTDEELRKIESGTLTEEEREQINKRMGFQAVVLSTGETTEKPKETFFQRVYSAIDGFLYPFSQKLAVVVALIAMLIVLVLPLLKG